MTEIEEYIPRNAFCESEERGRIWIVYRFVKARNPGLSHGRLFVKFKEVARL